MKKIFFCMMAALFIGGCGGEVKELQMRDTAGATKTVEVPKGTITGAASANQARTLAEILVASHNMSIGELSEIKANTKKSLENEEALKAATQRLEAATQRLEDSSRKILETSRNNLETSEKALRIIEQMSKRHGTGEITIFFPLGSSELKQGSMEFERLVHYADFLSRESRGRKILLISIGSASAVGNKKVNNKLAKKRSDIPTEVLSKYLINIPHEFYKIYSTGDVYSPKNVSIKEHQKYQHARIIAVFEADQAPSLPEEPADAAVPQKSKKSSPHQ